MKLGRAFEATRAQRAAMRCPLVHRPGAGRGEPLQRREKASARVQIDSPSSALGLRHRTPNLDGVGTGVAGHSRAGG